MDDCVSNLETINFACVVCGKAFKYKSHLTRHVRMHSGDKPFRCIVCDKSFTQKSGLTRHMLVHSGKKDVQCHVCGKYFARGSKKTLQYSH